MSVLRLVLYSKITFQPSTSLQRLCTTDASSLLGDNPNNVDLAIVGPGITIMAHQVDEIYNQLRYECPCYVSFYIQKLLFSQVLHCNVFVDIDS
jgi:cellobiose-specific phosphotransferase system component IIB